MYAYMHGCLHCDTYIVPRIEAPGRPHVYVCMHVCMHVFMNEQMDECVR
jgi:hypothetical protein